MLKQNYGKITPAAKKLLIDFIETKSGSHGLTALGHMPVNGFTNCANSDSSSQKEFAMARFDLTDSSGL